MLLDGPASPGAPLVEPLSGSMAQTAKGVDERRDFSQESAVGWRGKRSGMRDEGWGKASERSNYPWTGNGIQVQENMLGSGSW